MSTRLSASESLELPKSEIVLGDRLEQLQDEVLQQLDALDARIIALLEEVARSREGENSPVSED